MNNERLFRVYYRFRTEPQQYHYLWARDLEHAKAKTQDLLQGHARLIESMGYELLGIELDIRQRLDDFLADMAKLAEDIAAGEDYH